MSTGFSTTFSAAAIVTIRIAKMFVQLWNIPNSFPFDRLEFSCEQTRRKTSTKAKEKITTTWRWFDYDNEWVLFQSSARSFFPQRRKEKTSWTERYDSRLTFPTDVAHFMHHSIYFHKSCPSSTDWAIFFLFLGKKEKLLRPAAFDTVLPHHQNSFNSRVVVVVLIVY